MRIPRRAVSGAALAGVFAAALWGQQFQFNLDHLAGKASDSVDVSLNSNMLQFAAKFMNTKDPDEARVKQLIMGLEGIYVRSFEFKNAGAYSTSDLDQVRNQLKGPDWARIFGVKNSDGENIEVWVRSSGSKVGGHRDTFERSETIDRRESGWQHRYGFARGARRTFRFAEDGRGEKEEIVGLTPRLPAQTTGPHLFKVKV